jgi:hypothetical protein
MTKASDIVFDLSLYDAIEVSPVTGADEIGYEVCGEDEPDIAMWSVYLHLKEGGVECIADCATKHDAYFIAQALHTAFPSLHVFGPSQWCEVKVA